jgi:hypothetical protein
MQDWKLLHLRPRNDNWSCEKTISFSASLPTSNGMAIASWKCYSSKIEATVNQGKLLYLACTSPRGVFNNIHFACYGNYGPCDKNCSAIIENECLNKNNCTMKVDGPLFGQLQQVDMKLVVVASCSNFIRFLDYNVTVPVGSKAYVYLPTIGKPWRELHLRANTHLIWDGDCVNTVDVPGIVGIEAFEMFEILVVSGSYHFQLEYLIQ